MSEEMEIKIPKGDLSNWGTLVNMMKDNMPLVKKEQREALVNCMVDMQCIDSDVRPFVGEVLKRFAHCPPDGRETVLMMAQNLWGAPEPVNEEDFEEEAEDDLDNVQQLHSDAI